MLLILPFPFLCSHRFLFLYSHDSDKGASKRKDNLASQSSLDLKRVSKRSKNEQPSALPADIKVTSMRHVSFFLVLCAPCHSIRSVCSSGKKKEQVLGQAQKPYIAQAEVASSKNKVLTVTNKGKKRALSPVFVGSDSEKEESQASEPQADGDGTLDKDEKT
jgi:hypothetical protein